MKLFLKIEGAYLIIAFVILLITIFVTTRPFMSKNSLKKGTISVLLILTTFIGLHYIITKKRIESVKTAFLNGQLVLCENRIYTKGAQFITINKNNGFRLQENYFVSPNYIRPFFLARCIVK